MLDYISVAEAIGRPGLRLVLSPGFPGPWSVAAKAILDLKGIEYTPVAQSIGKPDKELRDWTGQESAPVAVLNAERARARWDEILLLAERLRPTPRLIPADEYLRAEMFGLANSICGEDGLGWNFRLFKMQQWEDALAGRSEEAMFLTREQVDIMQQRYGDPSRTAADAMARMVAVLRMLAKRLRANRERGSDYIIDDQVTALDLYWTAFSNLVAPMSHEHCPMPEGYRSMGESMMTLLGDAVDPLLIQHRDEVLRRHFALPLRF